MFLDQSGSMPRRKQSTMQNLLITAIDWDTDNLTLVQSLPHKILILNVPPDWDERQLNPLLERKIGVPIRGYVADAVVNLDGRLDCVVITADVPQSPEPYSPAVIAFRAMQVLALTKETREYLDDKDPKALEQLLDAITALETMPEVHAYQVKDGLVRPPKPDWVKPPRTTIGRSGM